jgi:polysaccharide deacetylase family sporulation protein PdaB
VTGFIVATVWIFHTRTLPPSLLQTESPEVKGHDVVRDVPTEEKVIALSFDDGPSPKFTPQILDILNENSVPATFFAVGMRIEQFPDVARAIAAQHELANHSYSHPHWNNPSKEEVQEEINRASDVIYAITGQRPHLFRPPEGYWDQTVIDAAKELHYQTIMWSWRTDPKDWANPGVYQIVQRIVKNARPGEIVILHDCGGNRIQTVVALPEIIKQLKAKGYRFVTVSELLQLHPDLKANNVR